MKRGLIFRIFTVLLALSTPYLHADYKPMRNPNGVNCNAPFIQCVAQVDRAQLLTGSLSAPDACIITINKCDDLHFLSIPDCQTRFHACIDQACTNPTACLDKDTLKAMGQSCFDQDPYTYIQCNKYQILDGLVKTTQGEMSGKISAQQSQNALQQQASQAALQQQQMQNDALIRQQQVAADQQKAQLQAQQAAAQMAADAKNADKKAAADALAAKNSPEGKLLTLMNGTDDLIDQAGSLIGQACQTYAQCDDTGAGCNAPLNIATFKYTLRQGLGKLTAAGSKMRNVMQQGNIIGFDMTEAMLSIGNRNCLVYQHNFLGGISSNNGGGINNNSGMGGGGVSQNGQLPLSSTGQVANCVVSANNMAFFQGNMQGGDSSVQRIQAWLNPKVTTDPGYVEQGTCQIPVVPVLQNPASQGGYTYNPATNSNVFQVQGQWLTATCDMNTDAAEDISVCLCDRFIDNGPFNGSGQGDNSLDENDIQDNIANKVSAICTAVHGLQDFYSGASSTMQIAISKAIATEATGSALGQSLSSAGITPDQLFAGSSHCSDADCFVQALQQDQTDFQKLIAGVATNRNQKMDPKFLVKLSGDISDAQRFFIYSPTGKTVAVALKTGACQPFYINSSDSKGAPTPAAIGDVATYISQMSDDSVQKTSACLAALLIGMNSSSQQYQPRGGVPPGATAAQYGY